MADVYLGLGSNLGDKQLYLQQAIEKLAPAGSVEEISSLYATEPVGNKQQDWFLNAAVKLRCGLPPQELLGFLLAVEKQLGRVRTEKNAPRTIDLDVLLYDGLVIGYDTAGGDTPQAGEHGGRRLRPEAGEKTSGSLVVPHPRLHERRFVLEPLAEIAPGIVHPVLGRTIRELADALVSNEQVKLVEKNWFSSPGTDEPPFPS